MELFLSSEAVVIIDSCRDMRLFIDRNPRTLPRCAIGTKARVAMATSRPTAACSKLLAAVMALDKSMGEIVFKTRSNVLQKPFVAALLRQIFRALCTSTLASTVCKLH